MGHLFSRAIKRLTFGAGNASRSDSRSQLPEQQEHAQNAGQSSGQRESAEQDSDRSIVQAIPVGQSIDSSEYAAFENASSVLPKAEESIRQSESVEKSSTGDKENAPTEQAVKSANDEDDNNKPEVEEAVIKIQALVRGHLTRKALKDAQQHSATVPPNALGQRQFDEESLIKNPPSAIFLPSSPLSSSLPVNQSGNDDQQQQQQTNKHPNARVPPLESIAEDVETSANSHDSSALPLTEEQKEKRRLSSQKGSADSTAATAPSSPSEANASIDIHCDTPASASIDIADHNSGPTFGIASVLHPNSPRAPVERLNQCPIAAVSDSALQERNELEALTPANLSSPFGNNHHAAMTRVADTMSATTGSLPASSPHIHLAAVNSHSIDSAEAAAIRIQSAFRGYHTRKHSPYRRRSPASGAMAGNELPAQMNGHGGPARFRNTLRQQDATDAMEDDEDEGLGACERLEPTSQVGVSSIDGRLEQVQGDEQETENRQSRQRHRVDATASLGENGKEIPPASSSSIEDLNTTTTTTTTTEDQDTVKEVTSSHQTQKPADTSSVSTAEERTEITADPLTAVSAKLTVDDGERSQAEGGGVRSDLRAPIGERASRLSADGWSVEMDTDSSNLGAALSLSDDLSESVERETKLAREIAHASAAAADSMGRLASEAESVASQLIGELEQAGASSKDDNIGRKASEHQLDAALVEETDDDYESGRLAENLANTILEDNEDMDGNDLEEHHESELASDDIERRNPRGSDDLTKSPQIRTESFEDQQPALVSAISLDEQECAPQDAGGEQDRLEVVSPDEAIGSGRSSPALASTSNCNSSDDDVDAENQEADEDKTRQPGDGQQQGAAGAGKNKKKSRNKRRSKK